jgi:hypothetical protein
MKIGKAKIKKSKEDYEAVIADANKTAPGNKYVASCRQFLETNGFLSPKQIEALEALEPVERIGNVEDDEAHYDDPYNLFDDPSDLD